MINKFLKLNKKILNHYRSREQIALVNRERPEMAIESSIIISAIANKKKMNTIIISDNLYKNINKIYRSFGFKNFFIVSGFLNYVLSFFNTFLSIICTIRGIYQINFFSFEKFINTFYVNNILIGDLIYDTYIRFNSSFIRPRVDFKLVKIIFFSSFKTYRLKNFLKKNNIKYLFVLTDCYATNESISIRLATKNNIKVFKINAAENRMFMVEAKKYMQSQGFLPLYKYFSKKKISEKIKLNDKHINKFLKNRFSGKIDFSYCSSRDLINANKNKLKYSKKEFLKKIKKNLINFDKIILFAPHAFSDAPHHFGTNFIFNDYYEQFIETINFFNSYDKNNILWLVRPHPSTKIYNEENIVKNFIKNSKNKNIIYCSTDLIGTKNLIEICDHVVTGRGTIGLEFACYGKKPITAGASTYSKFDISDECKTKEDYFNKLKNLNRIKPLTAKQKKIAKKLLYYIELSYPLHMNTTTDQMLFNFKKKSILNYLNKVNSKNKTIWTKKFFEILKLKDLKQDVLYKFYFDKANIL